MKHVICIKLKDNSDEHLNKVKELLLSMKGRVPMLEDIWVGTDYLHSPRSFDIVMVAELTSKEVLDDYQKDPYHDGVVKAYLSTAAEKIIAIDCE